MNGIAKSNGKIVTAVVQNSINYRGKIGDNVTNFFSTVVTNFSSTVVTIFD